MKKIRILALHLAYGGIEKAIISMANLFVERYDVEILSVYNMPGGPAFPLDKRVAVRYLMDDIPNREEWKAACKAKNPVAILREGFKSVHILREKKRCVIEAIKAVNDGVIISTRPEHNILLSQYGNKNVLKIAQFHQDHRFEKQYIDDFSQKYGNIDIFAHLTPSLMEEVSEMMKNNHHTKHAYVPNFLETLPDLSEVNSREKTIVSVGRLHPVKGFDRLISAFAKLADKFPEWKVKIIGDGEEQGKLQAMIKEYGLENQVLLCGKMDSSGLETEMKKASIIVMTSHSEGLSFVTLESQSCGLPIVAYDVRVGNKMVVKDGVNGFLVPDGDEKEFVDKLGMLMENSLLCAKMSENAVKRAQDFSKESVSKIWFDVLENQI